MKERLLAHLNALVGTRHSRTSRHELQQVQTYLSDQFCRLGVTVDLYPFHALGETYHNVVATVAAHRQAPALIVAAHFDTVADSPGADDNASGLAVLLEAARLIQAARLTRPVRFIGFNLEEENLLGSQAYVEHLRQKGEEILGAIVLECVGYARGEPRTQQRPTNVPIDVPSIGDFLAVVGNQASQEFVSAITSAVSRAVPPLKIVPLVVPGRGEHLPDTRRSDHAAFWDHDYPAVMLTDTASFRNPHYHRPTDTIDTLDLTFLGHVTLAVTAAIRDLAGRPT
ncbi:MAG TPA: M20/M25/M40 family metallo-hydrolase [Nitrospiraceae bacterium]|nr:M20/M25/M40 family metallo-hydrolase [Nitrospiraceae bacterium]